MATEMEQRKECVQAIIKTQSHPPTSKQEPQLQPQSTISQMDVQKPKLTPFPKGAQPHYNEPVSDPQTQANKSESCTIKSQTHVHHIEGQTCKLDITHEQNTSKSDSSGSIPDFTGSMEGGQLPICVPQTTVDCPLGDKPDTICKKKGKIGYKIHTHLPHTDSIILLTM